MKVRPVDYTDLFQFINYKNVYSWEKEYAIKLAGGSK